MPCIRCGPYHSSWACTVTATPCGHAYKQGRVFHLVLLQGYYCATVNVDIMTGTGRLNSGAGPEVPLKTLSTQRDVCFYKLDQRPTADVTFKSCGEQCECSRGARE